MIPSISVDGLACVFLVFVITQHDIGAASDDFASNPADSALLDEADAVEARFIENPADLERVNAWNRMQDRLLEMRRPGVKEIVDHIDHAVRFAGIDHVGIGTDFDGIQVPPAGLEDVSQLPVLWDEMRRRGYSENEIQKVSGGNLMAVWRRIVKCSELAD